MTKGERPETETENVSRTTKNEERRTHTDPDAETGRSTDEAYFGFERLEVYAVAAEFELLSPSLLPPKGHANLRDQLERATRSIVNNICEGAGKRTYREKRTFYDIATGSAMECGAMVESLQRRRLLSPERYRTARRLLLRIVQMLTKLSTSRRWRDHKNS